MRKIFQILNGFCYWDASNVIPSLQYASENYSSELVFVDAPKEVHEGWIFDGTKTGDDRFIPPPVPEGWYYDMETGTFNPINPPPPEIDPTVLMQAQLQAQADRIEFLEDVIAEMAMQVYSV